MGVWGALMQANAYYAFRISEFPGHVLTVFREALTKGGAAALQEIHTAAKLGENKGENRAKSLIGLYLVFCGFFLNLVGASLAFAATLVDTACHR